MRNLNEHARVTGSSLPEVQRALDMDRVRLGTRAKKGAKCKPGEFLTAIVIHFLDMPEALRLATVAYGLARLEALKAGEDEGGDWQRPAAAPAGGGGGNPGDANLAATVVAAPPAPRRRKQAGR